MHSWRPYAKHPTFEFAQQDDRDGKFKVGAQGGDRNIRGDGEGELHLALNSGHDACFPDVIQWSCAAPMLRLMKTHASNDASQMIPRPCIRFVSRRARFRFIVRTNGVPVTRYRTSLGHRYIAKVARRRSPLSPLAMRSFIFPLSLSFSLGLDTAHTIGTIE